MGIGQIKIWAISCDKCGRVYDDPNIWYSCTKKEAIEMIKNDEWWQYKNGKVYCEDCRTY